MAAAKGCRLEASPAADALEGTGEVPEDPFEAGATEDAGDPSGATEDAGDPSGAAADGGNDILDVADGAVDGQLRA